MLVRAHFASNSTYIMLAENIARNGDWEALEILVVATAMTSSGHNSVSKALYELQSRFLCRGMISLSIHAHPCMDVIIARYQPMVFWQMNIQLGFSTFGALS